MRRLLIAGSRNVAPSNLEIDKALCLLRQGNSKWEQFTVVTGGARGADTAGEQWALMRRHLSEVHPADWDRYKKRAGFIRNKEMVDSGLDYAMFFWDGESKGTAMTMKLVRAAKIPHLIQIIYPKETHFHD